MTYNQHHIVIVKLFGDYYGEIEISGRASGAYPKSAFQIRNREMVDRADLIICYIKQNSLFIKF